MKTSITLLLVFSNLLVFSQADKHYIAEEFKSELILMKKKAVVIYNGPKHSFTYDVIGDSIRPEPKPYLLTVNHKLFKSYISPFSQKFNFEKLDEDFAKQNMIGMMNHLKITYHDSKDLNKNYEFLSINGKWFLFWESLSPSWEKAIAKQFYVVTLCFDQVLILNVPILKVNESSVTDEGMKGFMTSICKSLTLNNHTVDIEKLRKELKGK